MRQSRASLLVVYGVVFASFFDSHALTPLIAPYAKSLGASVALAGWIVGAYSAVNLLGNLGAGYWIDRLGRKRPIVIGLVLVGVALSLYPFAADPTALLALRIAHGLGAALVAPASLAYIGDTAAPHARGRAMALYGAASGIAGLMGPPLSGLIRDRLGYAYVFAMLAALMFVIAIPAFAAIQESLPSTTERAGARVRDMLRNRRLLVAYTSAFCWMFALGTLLVFLPLTGQALGWASARVGLLFASFAFAAFIVQASPLGQVSDKWGRARAMMLGFAVIALALAGLSGLNSWEAMMGAMFVVGIGFGFLFPALTALVSDETEPHTRGTAAGIFTAVFSLGVVAGTGSAGALAWLQQTTTIHPFQFAALVVGAGLVWVSLEGINGLRGH